MLAKRTKRIMYVLIAIITVLVVFPFIWMLVLSFKSNAEILSNPLALPHTLSWGNYVNALKTLDYPRLYANTFMKLINKEKVDQLSYTIDVKPSMQE